MKGKWMKIVRQYTIITLGISMMAVGVYFFKFPNNFVFGGVTGAAADEQQQRLYRHNGSQQQAGRAVRH